MLVVVVVVVVAMVAAVMIVVVRWSGRGCDGGGNGSGGGSSRVRQRVLVVDLPADVGERGAGVLGLEGEADADDLERVRDEDGRDAGEGARREPPHPRLPVPLAPDQHRAVLLVRDELDGRVRVDLEERGRVAPEQARRPVPHVDVRDRPPEPRPAARVLGELRVARLEQDLHPVEGRYRRFGLWEQEG